MENFISILKYCILFQKHNSPHTYLLKNLQCFSHLPQDNIQHIKHGIQGQVWSGVEVPLLAYQLLVPTGHLMTQLWEPYEPFPEYFLSVFPALLYLLCFNFCLNFIVIIFVKHFLWFPPYRLSHFLFCIPVSFCSYFYYNAEPTAEIFLFLCGLFDSLAQPENCFSKYFKCIKYKTLRSCGNQLY